MFRLVALSVALVVGVPAVAQAEEGTLSRREGFLMIWEGIHRPADKAKQAFDDVPSDARGFAEISYAEDRGILDEEPAFRPDEPLQLVDALVWLFRTCNIDAVANIGAGSLPTYLARYPLPVGMKEESQEKDVSRRGRTIRRTVTTASVDDHPITETELRSLIDTFDAMLRDEVHEISFYSEKFHGDGTAFGETFDMYAMTAAHKYFPYNTLVRVTHVETGKSVIVRINDRGPFVPGRDMDLSFAAFTTLVPRSAGKTTARFERLGDASMVSIPSEPCARISKRSPRRQRCQN